MPITEVGQAGAGGVLKLSMRSGYADIERGGSSSDSPPVRW